MRLWSMRRRRSRERPPLVCPTPFRLPNQVDPYADKGYVGPRQGNMRLRSVAVTVAASLVVATGAASARPALAETATPSPAAQIAHAEFLPYMDPPPRGAATVCLVDTGVD